MQFAERDFMENIKKITDIQQKLIVLIKKFEEKSKQLLECDIDEIANLVNSRQSIIDRIIFLSNEIYKLCDEDSLQRLAFENKCDRSSLSEEEKEIFDLRQEFNIYAVRAHNMDSEIIGRIQIYKDKLLVKIKQNNSGVTAKAAKYYNAGLSQGKNLYFPENKRKI